MGIIREYIEFTGRRKALYKKSLALTFANSFFEALPILAIVLAVDGLLNDDVTYGTILKILLVMLVSILGCIALGHTARMTQCDVNYNMVADLRRDIGNRMKYMPMGSFNKNSLGEITNAMTTMADDVQTLAPRIVETVLKGTFLTVVIAIGFAVMSPVTGLVIFISLGAFLAVNLLLRAAASKMTPERVANFEDLNASTVEYVHGIEIVRSFNLLEREGGRLEDAIDESRRVDTTLELKLIPYVALQNAIVGICGVGIMAIAVWLWTTGSLSTLFCLMMVVAAFVVFNSLETAGSSSSLLSYVQNCMDSIKRVLNRPLMGNGGKTETPEDKTLRFDDVTFSYGGRDVLKNVSFEAREGTVTAIVGPSGSGKTTVCNLAARFWDPKSGAVTMGGVDVREFDQDAYLRNFSMVFQRVYMFNDTIANNIKFGRPEATDEEMHDAARRACCHDFIMSLPDGYDTVLGEGGSRISGGEKQRISIARAILKDAPIVILDEATANVDPENEDQLQKAVYELTAGKTIIMIAHRLKTVRSADQILVMDDGSIVQRGTHDALLSEEGIYRDFVVNREVAIGWKFKPVERAG